MTSQEEYMQELEEFADWVARVVCTEEFKQDDADWFAEIACRRLWRLGFVKMDGDYWSHETEAE